MKPRYLTQSALIAALYVAISYLQNMLLPGTSSFAIQIRVAEALCVLALFSRAAIPGLAVGCLIFNIAVAWELPPDVLIGTGASAISALLMWLLRKHPLPALAVPALVNGVLIGWELTVFIGGGFWLNAGYVALGEAIVLYTLGTALYFTLKKHPVLP